MSPKKEKLLNDTYHKWMQTGLYDLPLDGINDFVDPKIMGYGTAVDEKVLSISEYRELINTQRKQAVGLEMSIETTPVFRSISNKEDSAIFVDEITVSIIVNENKQGLFLRITTILEYSDNKWKVVHWHGSIPTETTAESDAWLVNEWKRKNEELQKLVDEKTSELLNKNRELEIETALEKVRSSALAMKEPADMVDVCRIISDQLQTLGITNIRNVQTAIINEQKSTYLNYQYFTSYNKSTIEEAEYNKHPKACEMAETMKRSANASYSQSFDGKDLDGFREYRKHDNQFPDPILDESTSLHFYFYSIGPGALGLSTYNFPLSENELSILKRFRNVFELAYRRFIDIELAIAQAREARIEAALEKIRSRALAMRNSSEVGNVSTLLFLELEKMDINPSGFSIMIFDEKQDKYELWRAKEVAHQGAYETFSIKAMYDKFDQYVPGFGEELKSAWTKGNPFFIGEFRGEKRVSFLQANREMASYSDEVFEKMKKGWPDPTFWHLVFFKYGWFGVLQNEQLIKEDLLLIHRFAEVFDFAYTRFLDLQKAEAQAREAQIEASLERVRAVAMGMNKSDDLLSICEVSFKEFKKLGFDNIRNALIHIQYDNQKYFMDYDFSDLTGGAITKIEYGSHPIVEDYLKQIRSAKDAYFEVVIEKDQLEGWKDFRKKSGQKDDPRLDEATAIYYYVFSIGVGDIGISTFKPIEDSQKKILKRFRNVFDLAYKRYVDIALAETQARESQIELALERVRARTMAMNRSDELSETAAVLFNEIKKTTENELIQLTIGIYNEAAGLMEMRVTSWAGGGVQENRAFNLSIEEPTLLKPAFMAWKQRKKSIVIDLSGEQLEGWLKYRNANTGVTVRSEDTKGRRVITVAFFSKGHISLSSPLPLSAETIQLLERFAIVFDGTYTRFLDLQKAEAQAREAKIEASMEKIRSRSLAMQKPGELVEVAELLRKEMGLLGVEELETSSIYIVDEENQKVECWYAIKDIREENKRLVSDEMTLTLSDTWVGNEMWKFYRSKEGQISIVMKGDNRKEWINDCANKSKVLQGYYGNEIPERTYHLVKFNGGYMGAASPGDISSESWDFLKRAAAVFSLAYTRFKDLQEAEASAREAQIEAALERVRSRTMGMQKSIELKDVIRIVYEQFVHLKINVDHAGFVVDYKPKGDWHFWIADEQDIPSKITHPYFESVWAKQFNVAKEKGADFFATNLNFEEKNKFYNELLSHVHGLPEASKDFYLSCPGLAVSTVLLENVSLYIENFSGIPYSDEENNTLMRFGKVFQQTYTRFLDLQKAEAQAREAQIELSLERIRAQVTAMRESHELLDIVVTMRSEFVALGHEAHYFWHMRWLPDKYEKAMTSGDGTRIGMVMSLPRHIHGDVKLVADWEKSDDPALVFAMDVDTAVEYVEKMITLGDFQQVDPQAPTLDDIRHIGGLTFIMARTTHGEIGFSLPGTVPNPPEESVTTLARFAGVFDLAYRRFEDLKEAEEKNKIIQADNDRKTKELEDARQLQLAMLPRELPKIPHLDIAVYMKTATEVGGDYYDFNVDANGTLTFIVGDATGHGMMSGMMVSIMKSFFISNKANIELKQFFENANNSIKDMQLGRLMMGLIGIQITSEKIIATNAGMPSLIYFRNKSQKAGEFVSNNLPLGGMKGTQYLLKEINYEKGDTFLLMSDGFAELKNPQSEQYGYTRVKEQFRSIAHKSANDIIEELRNTASQWTNEAEPDDDITFVVIKVK